jgi:nucleoside-diphosphate-sugar epimerase|tara:strand:- start:59 stop:385 length:327 start_codon:yes stop_codon:yes gene_type:complete
MIRKFKCNKKKLYFENMNHYRDFLIIDDIVKAIKILLIYKTRGTYNICSPKRINLVKLIKKIIFKNKKELIINKNNNQTILIDYNRKLKKLHWKPTNINYYNYLIKIF